MGIVPNLEIFPNGVTFDKKTFKLWHTPKMKKNC